VGICICWIPGLGWFGAVAGILGCAAGVPSITHWFHKPGYGPWGISGLVTGVSAADLSLAYQLKYTGGALEGAVFAIDPVVAGAVCVFAIGLTAMGLVLARTKNRPIGILLTATALVALIAVGTSALVTADRKYEADPSHLSAVK
jgi:hypothetical protein